MLPTEPLPLHHSWPLFERGLRFPLGMLHAGTTPTAAVGGTFSCDLVTDGLTWSAPLFQLFGIADDTPPARERVLPLYEEGSRAALERLRAHAIRHRRGFTLDTHLQVPGEPTRWVRVVVVPQVVDGRVATLTGLQHDVTHEYR